MDNHRIYCSFSRIKQNGCQPAESCDWVVGEPPHCMSPGNKDEDTNYVQTKPDAA